ncbi:MAG: adenylyltransferase/cytidyltransferase family protein [bacterium]|nr:adenylyltransferase/cytidyltransferase family protein [bacterium]
MAGALRVAENARRAGKRVVSTNGCFDMLHVGHVRYLAAAKKLGDVLIVGVNSDTSVRENKGPSRPLVRARERAEILAALECVDYAFTFPGRTPCPWIKKLRPDIHVKGGGKDVPLHPDFPAMKAAVEQAGGRLVLVAHTPEHSTSALIRKIRDMS